MNPSELRMMWMSQYNPSLEDATSFYGQPGLSIMDDHQSNAMELNPMMSIVGGEYGGQNGSNADNLNPNGSHGLISTTNPHDIFGLAQNANLSGIPHILQQHSTSGPFTQYTYDDNEVLESSNNEDLYQQQNFENYNDLYKQKDIINIDDFVMNDSNSNDDISLIQQQEQQNQSHQRIKTRKTRKIEPVNRPGLVLKTPIAYKGNIDPSVIPIERDGMAVCQRCGAIGVKHTFYTKSRRFCSMACARGELFNLVCNNEAQQSNKISANSNNIINNNSFNQILNNSINNRSISGNNSNNCSNIAEDQKLNNISNSIPSTTDLELELRVSHIRNSGYRFKMSNSHNDENFDKNNGNDNYNDIFQSSNHQHKLELFRDLMPQGELPQIPKPSRLPSPCLLDDKIFSVRRRTYNELNSYEWTPLLSDADFIAAPVTCFPHAPGYDMWDNIGVNMKVEVENTDCDGQVSVSPGQQPHSFWVATVLNINGYKALMRYEGFDDDSHDFWVNLCSSEVHPVGWCATRGKPLIPPRTIENKYNDWKDFLVTRLSGARTLPSNFYNKISDSFKSRFRCGLNLECVDKMRISQVKLATVNKIIGKRLYVKYYDSDDGFWCHEDAPIIHPVGWATTVGHNLAAPHEYMERMLAGREQIIEVHEDDATIELFKMNFTFEEYYLEGKTNCFIEGMKLEAVDPLNLSSICVATVMAVLKFGYMMIRIDSYDPDATGADWFCYHEKSPSIFPVGFCESHNLPLTPPNGYNVKTFTWDKYLQDTNSLPAHDHLFHRDVPDHGFQNGMKLECADLMDPRLVCVATVSRVVGRLLKIRFDGWPEEYDQWLDCESSDFYPVGWCVLVNHKLEGPPTSQKSSAASKASSKTVRKKKKKRAIKTESAVTGHRGRPSSLQYIKKEPEIQNIVIEKQINTRHINIKTEVHDEYEFEDDDDIDESASLRSVDNSTTSISNTPEPNDTKLKRINNSGNLNTISINQKSLKSISPAPTERKATSYIGNSSVTSGKLIPRLSDGTVNNVIMPIDSSTSNFHSINSHEIAELVPSTWNIYDVSQFLRVNDCVAHCDTFARSKIDGKRFMELTKDEIVQLLGMKVGPALKIFDLIQQLKCKLNPNKSRLSKTSNNKKFL